MPKGEIVGRACRFHRAVCTVCIDCTDCRNCIDCTYCTDCTVCRGCTNCRDCRDCRGCRDCSDCSDYKENPKRIVSSKIGSREAQTSIYWTSSKDVQVVCGCFRGDLKTFESEINKTHKDNKKHLEDYLNLIRVSKYNIKNL